MSSIEEMCKKLVTKAEEPHNTFKLSEQYRSVVRLIMEGIVQIFKGGFDTILVKFPLLVFLMYYITSNSLFSLNAYLWRLFVQAFEVYKNSLCK